MWREGDSLYAAVSDDEEESLIDFVTEATANGSLGSVSFSF
jgi:hypothetical protein